MNYASIKEHDTANGVGIRVSLFVSGCTHHCEGCFNQEAWDFCYGQKYTDEVRDRILESCKHDYIRGLSLLGGEPFEIANQKDLCQLLIMFKQRYPQKDVWCYSGYLFDVDMVEGGRIYTNYTQEMLKRIDYLVDGKFVLNLKNLKLKFRGSSNQRIIDVQKSLKDKNTVVLSDEEIV